MDETDNPIDGATRGGLPVSPSLGPSLRVARVAAHPPLVDRRVVLIAAISVLLAIGASAIAEGLLRLIWLITNLSFHGRVAADPADPTIAKLGLFVIAIPAIGGIVVGFMARYGSEGIRGHGIPEAMQQVLIGQSRIPARLMFLKPLSAAVAIGTGGPFGAEGPIIATGGAAGSVIGQFLKTTASERKTLLAAGAAAGMAATFGSPVSAALLAMELLLFEFRARSFIPVALASTAAAGMRFVFKMPYPLFPMPRIEHTPEWTLLVYVLIGAAVGVVSAGVTKAVYAVEDLFEKLPIHWMWWPALGGIAVGLIGYFAPDTLGVGYDNITREISGNLAVKALAILCVLKFVSWTIALGSGTSGGTLAPLFTIGGAMGALLGAASLRIAPHCGVDVRIAALVGMAALFAGASRAVLTSVVFAFETTLQPFGLLPLLGGCSAAYFVSCALMTNTIMTAKITRHGVRVPAEFVADFLDQLLVGELATRNVVCLRTDQTAGAVRRWLVEGSPDASHQGYPVLDESGRLEGLITRPQLRSIAPDDTRPLRDLLDGAAPRVYSDSTLREAADLMVELDYGRLPVVDRKAPDTVSGIITRRDLLSGHRRRLAESGNAERSIPIRIPRIGRFAVRQPKPANGPAADPLPRTLPDTQPD
jgi:H+/Cl- antiporter ClcA/CBS domain-containing protein